MQTIRAVLYWQYMSREQCVITNPLLYEAALLCHMDLWAYLEAYVTVQRCFSCKSFHLASAVVLMYVIHFCTL